MKLCCCYNCIHGTGPCTNDVCPEGWTAYDLRACKLVAPNLQKWCASNVPHNLHNIVSLSWADCLLALGSCVTFTALVQYISQNPLPPLVCNINTEILPAESNEIDFVALHYLPCDVPHSFAPIKIIGDGNCFPRTLSYLLFKDQEHYQEMHTHIVYEACLNKSRLLRQQLHQNRGKS